MRTNPAVIDFHSHILPQLDDGSNSVDTSLEMLRRSAQDGVDIMVATPHYYGTRHPLKVFLERREASWQRLQGSLTPDLPRIRLGAEVAFHSGVEDQEGLEQLCIQGTNYLLLEMPFAAWTGYELDVLSTLALDRGVRIILAHFERFYSLQHDQDLLARMLELPILLQINAGALLSFQRRGRWLKWLGQGKAHLLGSDCHNLGDRAPNLGRAREMVRRKLGDPVLLRIDQIGTEVLQSSSSQGEQA